MTPLSASDPPAPPLRAVVTGASSGIGRATALELARRLSGEGGESRIVVHFRRNRQGADETVASLERMGVAAVAVQADLQSADDRQQLLDRCWQFLQSPTTWVNNAGADVLTGSAGKLSFADKLRLLMDVDVMGTIELSRRVVDRWLAERADRAAEETVAFPPSMTFIGWDQAPHGMEGDAGQMFGPVKAAVMAFAASLAQEVAPHIRVNTVAPGWIKTAWGQSTDEYWNGRAAEQSLMRRWGTPADVAAAICFVADPANRFCTGQTLCVNGGWNRRYDPQPRR
jgi:3-oxoacyl-[acyl-carrier protein] reductase